MDVAEAALWFNTVPVDGWNGTAWVRKVGYGDFKTYDRFITERTFGVKKRIFHSPDDTLFDPTVYPVVRTPDGKTWIVVADNVDIEEEVTYAHSYLFLDAPLQADVIEHTTQLLASGAQGPLSESVGASYYCDLERFSAKDSSVFQNVTYGVYEVTLPYGAVIDTEKELRISGTYYEIKEVIPELLTVVCRCVQRA